MSRIAPKVSVILPIHEMDNGAFFLWRLIDSLSKQTFKDWELVITKDGKMAENANSAIKRARGEIIKVMQLDDYFYDENSLQDVVDAFTPGVGWVMSGCTHTYWKLKEGNIITMMRGFGQEAVPSEEYIPDELNFVNPHYPKWNDRIYAGVNTLGGLSTLNFRRDSHLLFEEPLTWVVDCDLYQRLYEKYGEPKLLNTLNVVIQCGPHQTTSKLTDKEKIDELEYLTARYQTDNYISQNYKLAEKTPSDINEHLGTLKRISANCKHITELGVRTMVSSWGFLEGMRPRGGKLISVDIKNPLEYGGFNPDEVRYECDKLDIDFQFIKKSSLEIELEETDLLFIDTLHFKEQLTKELALHADKAKKYIVLHDTKACEDELLPVMDEFLKNNPQWKVHEKYTHNNGLIVLKHD